MKESQPQAEVCLEETRAEAFSMLLNYLYTGRASLSSAREEVLLDFLGLAHRYGLQPLEDSTSEFLRTILHTNNVCLVFDVACLYSLSALCAACCAYMDRHAPEVLNSDGFLLLSKVRAQTLKSSTLTGVTLIFRRWPLVGLRFNVDQWKLWKRGCSHQNTRGYIADYCCIESP